MLGCVRMIALLVLLCAAAGSVDGNTKMPGEENCQGDSDNGSLLDTSMQPLHKQRRLLALTLPTSVTSTGGASAVFPSTSFTNWCTSDTTCNGLNSGVTLTLDEAPNTGIIDQTVNLDTLFSDGSIAASLLVSSVVDLYLTGYPGDALDAQYICGAANGCTATLSIPLLQGVYDASKSFVCLRLEPSSGTYTAVGYPSGTANVAVTGTIINGVLKCTTDKFGKHVIYQYALKSPPAPPPAAKPPAPPPPPPALGEVTDPSPGEVAFRFQAKFDMDYDAFKANEVLLEDFKSDVARSAARALAEALPRIMATGGNTAGTPAYERVVLLRIKRGSVWVELQVTAPKGSGAAEISALRTLLTDNTTTLFAYSKYASQAQSGGQILSVKEEGMRELSGAAVGGIIAGSLGGAVLLVSCVLWGQRYRTHLAILPKKPESTSDMYNLNVLRQRRDGPVKRRGPRYGEGLDDGTPAAAVGGAAKGGMGAAALDPMTPLPPPWEGAGVPKNPKAKAVLSPR